jgi:uncharacterized RDD family membrane protein YckC
LSGQRAAGTPYGRYAGFISRAVAFVIDAVIISVFVAALLAFAQFITGYLHLRWIDTNETPVLAAAVLIVFTWLYQGFFWWLAGQTPGKWFMGLRVVGVNGERMRFWMIVRRLIGYYLAALFLCLGFLWVLFDDRRQDWPDKLAGTFVVYSWPPPREVRAARSVQSVLSGVGLSTGSTSKQQKR